MIINSTGLAALFTGFHAAYKRGFKSFGERVMWQQIATQVPSSTESNLYGWLGHFPSLREWIGDRFIKNMKAENFTVLNRDYESTVAVDRNQIEDDRFGIFNPIFEDMGASAARHPDELLFALIVAGETTLGYDGQNFYDTDHPVGATTDSNLDTTGAGALWTLMDTTRPLKPIVWQMRKQYQFQTFVKPNDQNVFLSKQFIYGVDARAAAAPGLWQMAFASLNTLNETNFDDYIKQMMEFVSDEGVKLGVTPNLLVAGPTNRAAALTTIKTARLASGASNKNFNAVDLLVTPYLV